MGVDVSLHLRAYPAQPGGAIEGLNSNFSIYDADDSRQLLQMVGRDLGLTSGGPRRDCWLTCHLNLKNGVDRPASGAGPGNGRALR